MTSYVVKVRTYLIVSGLTALLCGTVIAPIVLGSEQVQSDRLAGEHGFVETQIETSASEGDSSLNIAHDPNSLMETPQGKTGILGDDNKRRQDSPDLADKGARDAAKRGIRETLAEHLEDRQVLQAAPPVPAPLEKPDSVRSFPVSPSVANMVIPARGRLAIAYREQKSTYGTPSMGVSIRTPDYAQVVAPYDGRIAYAGEFHSYGKILIIDHGEKIKTLLAGLDHIDAIAGQWVLAGEPIGKMGSAAKEPPLLYFELRQIGQPIDPLRWFATAELDALGGRISSLDAAPDELAAQVSQLEAEYDQLSRDLLTLGAQLDELTARIMKLRIVQFGLATLVAELSGENEDLSKRLDPLANGDKSLPMNSMKITQ